MLHTLCILGLLPFFISLYKSEAFAVLLHGDTTASVKKQDENWLKHLLIRLSLFMFICLVLFLISALERGAGGAYLMAYGMAYTLGIAALLLIIETFVLFSRKCNYKASANIFLIIVAVWSLLEMM
ncbi:hypothetical protein C7T94_08540 [Pedobacter yulinensis]|uniref:Uncharacterized protein n=2 Tax=Pedobacter yulinensis TaxID=2126353 RepID=A0A2T3HJR2_9SPHI|nr:hypothetical protein C7T94_08540 [Pedobacter yulinensis]